MQQKSQQNIFDYDDSDSANELIVDLLNFSMTPNSTIMEKKCQPVIIKEKSLFMRSLKTNNTKSVRLRTRKTSFY